MFGHAAHWQALCGLDHYTGTVVQQDFNDSQLIGQAPCRAVSGRSRCAETVACLRRTGGCISHDILLVSDSRSDEWLPFTAFPVLHHAIEHEVTVESVEHWPHRLEAWVQTRHPGDGRLLTWFHTDHWRDPDRLQPGHTCRVQLAGLAYTLQPADLQPEPWPRDNSPLLPCAGKSGCDDWQFQGEIEDLVALQHDGETIHRLLIRFTHPGCDTCLLPIHVAQRALIGYRPHVGDKVGGALWLQGRLAEGG